MSTQLELRNYQREAVNAVLQHFRALQPERQQPEQRPARHSLDDGSACLVLPTGAGKSVVIAELCRLARGRCLVLAHVKELVEQNAGKVRSLSPALGDEVGIFSAGLGEKDADARLVFASIQSAAAHLEEFQFPFSLVIVDECHRVSLDDSSQYQVLLRTLRQSNPSLRVLGLTATPYRLDLGWCYRLHAPRRLVRTDEGRPFSTCVYELPLERLVREGFLTQPRLVDAPIAYHDFSKGNQDDASSLFVRDERITRSIVRHVVELAEEQKRAGVMLFAASVDHAREVLAELPEGEAALVVGDTPGPERDAIVRGFKERQLRYLVNVSVLTTGFDAPHVDFIAILRRTESVGLFQQMAGRGLRLAPQKHDCLIIDYAGHGYDLFSPEVGSGAPTSDSVVVQVTCPRCSFDNDFWGRTDEEGHVIEHFGRRCHGQVEGEQRCDYRFVFKECPACLGECDIAARRCEHCGRTLVDPDDMLKDALGLKNARVLRVSGMELECRADVVTLIYHDEDGATLRDRFDLGAAAQRAAFNRNFARRIAQGRRPLELENARHVQALWGHFPQPDFVIARQKTIKGRAKWWKVEQRIFDYRGRYRRAARADGEESPLA